MAEVSEIEAGGEVRTIKDATARNGVAANAAAIEEINEKIPSNASSSNQMITIADRASFTKTVYTNQQTISNWYSLTSIDTSDIPQGNYLVSLQSSPIVTSQNVSCLLSLGGKTIAMSMMGGGIEMLSCPRVISKGLETALGVAFFLGTNATLQAGNFVFRFDKVN